jgi:hypothetical protein
MNMKAITAICIAVGLGMMVFLIPDVSATTFNGYYKGFPNQANLTSDTVWTVQNIGRFSVHSPNKYQGDAQGSDTLGITKPYNATIGYSGEGDFGMTDICLPSCSGNGFGITLTVAGVSFSMSKNTANSTIQLSDPCGSNYVAYIAPSFGSFNAHVVVSYVAPGTQVSFGGTGGFQGCTITCASCLSNYPNWGVQNIAVQDNTKGIVFTGGWIWNPNDGSTFSLNSTTTVEPSEFDTGLKSFATGLGFISPESQLLFALILIGITEIIMAFFTGFFGENGKWKLYTIHGVASVFGAICTLLGYLPFFVLIIAIVMGTTMVQGGRETFNTFKAIIGRARAASQDGPQPIVQGSPDGSPERPGSKDEGPEEPTGETPSEPVAPTEPEQESESEPQPQPETDGNGEE